MRYVNLRVCVVNNKIFAMVPFFLFLPIYLTCSSLCLLRELNIQLLSTYYTYKIKIITKVGIKLCTVLYAD